MLAARLATLLASASMAAGPAVIDARPAAAGAVTAAPDLAAAAAAPATPSPTANSLVLLLGRRQLLVLEDGRELRRFPVAVGMPGWETPVGQFEVIEMRANPEWEHPATGQVVPAGPNNPLGSRWIGFWRDCRGRSGFNGQEHLEVRGCVTVGFHGTPQRVSVGQAVSHGCVRLLDENVQDLYGLVELGTVVTVRP